MELLFLYYHGKPSTNAQHYINACLGKQRENNVVLDSIIRTIII